jgi:hypothetical protein
VHLCSTYWLGSGYDVRDPHAGGLGSIAGSKKLAGRKYVGWLGVGIVKVIISLSVPDVVL